MAAAQSGTPVSSDRIDFIDKNDAGRIFLALDEKIANPTGPHTHKHFDKIRPADREERYAGFTGDRARQQRFAGAGWPVEQHALGDATTQFLKLLGRLQKIDNLLQVSLHTFQTGDVIKRHHLLIGLESLRPYITGVS